MVSQALLASMDEQGVATLTLNRLEKHNAFDAELIRALIEALETFASNAQLRVLILNANGPHFSAGADLNWMRAMAEQDEATNLEDAKRLAKLMQTLDHFPAPTIASVQGAAFAGALGLICCCDIAIASAESRFCLSEVKLGLIPATIGPYVCRTLGQRHARRYMLSAETFDANTALQMGLVHIVVSDETQLPHTTQSMALRLLHNSPKAMLQVKQLCQDCASMPIESALIDKTSAMIAHARSSEEGQEGLKAFFSKRPPSWCPTKKDFE
ncbi:enoyl-CoA hydratase-related protein [Vibrio vulnificus]|uniref:enoyl-CoA hydratase-related protein n=1 Tax=Vibrio vulnificus TaxID=672 RepID=UPI000CCFFFEC|nr:enoyl-CoA hydratase-related protein [Vibrio vulnificus]AVX01279.1 gamma-carboxygeranoyl-CoA hydratase [Vibrio vulnificus Env1]POC68422.1 gamma-carboxygeranoyl-CoA hydratase [Vibrio vulnificus Env1]